MLGTIVVRRPQLRDQSAREGSILVPLAAGGPQGICCTEFILVHVFSRPSIEIFQKLFVAAISTHWRSPLSWIILKMGGNSFLRKSLKVCINFSPLRGSWDQFNQHL